MLAGTMRTVVLTGDFVVGVFLVGFGCFFANSHFAYTCVLYTHGNMDVQISAGGEHGQSEIWGKNCFAVSYLWRARRTKTKGTIKNTLHCQISHDTAYEVINLARLWLFFLQDPNCTVISVRLRMMHTSTNSCCNEPHIPGITHKTNKKSHSILGGVQPRCSATALCVELLERH